MRTCRRLTGPQRDTLEAAGFAIADDGLTAAAAGPMRVILAFPPSKNGSVSLTITFPNGVRIDCQTALRELIDAGAWEEEEGDQNSE